MSKPSQQALERAFPGKGKVLRELLTSCSAVNAHPAVRALVAQCCNKPSTAHKRMVALDAELETFGVEYTEGNGTQRSPSFEYCNTGDTYASTIVRFNDGRYRISSWGDIVERGNYA